MSHVRRYLRRLRPYVHAVRPATAPQMDEFHRLLADLRRLITDEGDAAGEATATLGQVLARLTASVDDMREELAALRLLVEAKSVDDGS